MTLYQELIDKKLLLQAWHSVYSRKSEQKRELSKGCDNISLADFRQDEKNGGTYLQEIFDELSSGKFSFQPFKGVPILKSDKKNYRLVCSPCIRDRVVQKAILTIISKHTYPHINTGVSYCGVSNGKKGKYSPRINTLDAVKKLFKYLESGNFWIFKSDIDSFFDNVDKSKLKKSLYSFLPDRSLAPLFEQIFECKLCNFEEMKRRKVIPWKSELNGIPQGSPLSPLLANIYLVDFDSAMKKIYGDSLIRYIDDFILVSNSKQEVKQMSISAIQELEKIKLKVNLTKSDILDLRKKDLKFLGLKISKFGITTKRSLPELKIVLIQEIKTENF
jgi:RNA-directed DNA polymerase